MCAPLSMRIEPEGVRVWNVHCFRECNGVGEGRKRVCVGRVGRVGVELELGVEVGEMAFVFDAVVDGSVVATEEATEEATEGTDAEAIGPEWIEDTVQSTISNTFFGDWLLAIIVRTPAAVAISAAMSFVSIPPVPSDEPRVEVDTGDE